MSGGGSKSIFHFLCYSLLMILCILFGYLFIFPFVVSTIHINTSMIFFDRNLFAIYVRIIGENIFRVYTHTISPPLILMQNDRYLFNVCSPIQIIILKIIYSYRKRTTQKNERIKKTTPYRNTSFFMDSLFLEDHYCD